MTLEELKKETLEAVETRARYVYGELKKESRTYNEVLEKARELCDGLEEEGNIRISREMAERIKDMNAGDKIEKAIADEAVAKKEVETAEQKKAKAQKEAETKVIKAKAEAEANKLKEKTLTKEILMQELLDKWNGELPKVTDGNSGIFNLDSLLK